MTPRLVAVVLMLPLLTVIADFMGLLGGFTTSFFIIQMNPSQYWYSAYHALSFEDMFQGLAKPLVFAFIVALVGCYYGLKTSGGTQGVGRVHDAGCGGSVGADSDLRLFPDEGAAVGARMRRRHAKRADFSSLRPFPRPEQAG